MEKIILVEGMLTIFLAGLAKGLGLPDLVMMGTVVPHLVIAMAGIAAIIIAVVPAVMRESS